MRLAPGRPDRPLPAPIAHIGKVSPLFLPLIQHESGVTMLAMLDLAGLLIMTTIAQFLHRALFVHLLLQTAKSALNGLVLTAFDFRHLLCHPL